jgi:hypothetical protein
MAIKANIQRTGSSPLHADAICGEIAPFVTAAGSSQATATLLAPLTRQIVNAGSGGVILSPGMGRGDPLLYGDEIEITNITLASINVYPPNNTSFYGYATNAPFVLNAAYSVSVVQVTATLLVVRYFAVNSGGVGLGTVTSVALAAPAEFTVSGSPIVNSGTLTLTKANENANTVWAGPTTGAAAQPSFRSLVAADIPSLSYAPLTSGSSILSGNGGGGFSNVTVGSGLTFSGGTLSAAGSGGTVTSVGMTVPSILSVSGSPITGSGTLAVTLANESANTVFAGPTSGGAATPTFRSLIATDLPNTAVTPGTYNISTITVDQQGRLTAASTGALTGDVTTSALAATVKANLKLADLYYVIDGGGSAITTGTKGYLVVDFACTITGSTLLADQSGSIVVNVWKCTYAQFDAGATHPVAADKITASAPPTISSATKANDTTLSGWTTTVNAGDILAFNVDSAATIQRCTIALQVTKT